MSNVKKLIVIKPIKTLVVFILKIRELFNRWKQKIEKCVTHNYLLSLDVTQS